MTADDRPGLPLEEPRASLSLLDYRRRVADMYAAVRSIAPRDGHALWRRGRDELFSSHPRSPIPPELRHAFRGLPVWDYDDALRHEVQVGPIDDDVAIGLPHSNGGTTPGRAVGVLQIPLPGGPPVHLTLFRLVQYGDALFLPFVDGTAGSDTYRGGRYLLDTAKGADLGSRGDRLVIDFNFAYHPSCVHDVIWSCPLAPASNRFPQPVRAGEHLGTRAAGPPP